MRAWGIATDLNSQRDWTGQDGTLWLPLMRCPTNITRQEPETQDAIRRDQAKEMEIMRKMDDLEKLEELQGEHWLMSDAINQSTAGNHTYGYIRSRCAVISIALGADFPGPSHNASLHWKQQ